jgi:hypothetical protein
MSSLFAAEFADASKAIDDVFGETFRLLPRVRSSDPNGADIPDAGRSERDFTAVFLDPQVKPNVPEAYDLRADLRPGASAGAPRIDIMPGVIASGLVVKVPDLIRCVATGKTWRVSSIFVTKAAIARCFVHLVG